MRRRDFIRVIGGAAAAWPLAARAQQGERMRRINQRTVYTLTCRKIDSSTLTETVVVTLVPVFQER